MFSKTIDFAVAKARKQQLIAEARQYQLFKSVSELEASVNAFIAAYGAYLRPSEVAYVKYLAQKARLVPGVIWAKIETIAREIGYNARTVKTAQKRLEEFGFIKRIQRRRSDGKQGSAFTVVQPFNAQNSTQHIPQNFTLSKPEKPRRDKHFEPFTTAKEKGNSLQVKEKHEKKNVQERDNVPTQFVQVARQHGMSSLKLWAKVRLAARHMGVDPATPDVAAVAVKTLRHNLRSLHQGKVYGDFAGYFYRSLCNQFAIYRRRTNASLYDWIGVSHAAAEAVAAVQEVAAAVAHQEQMEASGGYEERQERRIADDPELLALLMELEARKNGLSA